MDEDGSADDVIDDALIDAAYLRGLIQAFLDALQGYADAIRAGFRIHGYRDLEERLIALFDLGARVRLRLSEDCTAMGARPDLAEAVRRELAALADDMEAPANDATTRQQLVALQQVVHPHPGETSCMLPAWGREDHREGLLQGALVVGCNFPLHVEESDDRLRALARDLCWELWWPLPRALLARDDEVEVETREALQRAIAAKTPREARVPIAKLAGQYAQGLGAADPEDPFQFNLAGLLLATLGRLDLREEKYQPSLMDGMRIEEPPIPPGTARAELRRWITWYPLRPDVREVMRGVALEDSGHEEDFCNRVIAIRAALYRERRDGVLRQAIEEQGERSEDETAPTPGPGESGESGGSTAPTHAGARARAPARARAVGAGLQTPKTPDSPGEPPEGGKGDGVRAPATPGDAPCRLVAAENFEWIEDGETRYVFHKPQERAAVRVLWEAEGRPVFEDTIRDRIGAEEVDRFRLRDVFRRKNALNPAWGRLIQNTGPRTRMYVIPR